MDLRTLRTYYNRCKPDETLDPGDDRYVDIDAIDTAHPIRGADWVARLTRGIELSNEPVYELFTGLPGSGKSTELRRLAQRLQAQHQLLPVIVDGEEALDLSNPIDVPDIYFAILYYTDTKLLELEGKTPAGAMQQGYLSRFWHWITTTEVELKGGDFKVADPIKLVVELKSRPSLRARVRQFVSARLPRFLEECHDELRAMEQRAVALRFEGLAVVFDSLEKLRGTSTNWTAVMESAERMFGGVGSYLKLPVHALYTIPTALIARMRIDDVHFLPMIKLRQRDGEPFAHGVDAASHIVTKRVPLHALREILGGTCDARLARMVAWSGGYPREIVRMLQHLLETSSEKWPISDSDFDRLLNRIGDDYRKFVPTNTYEWLARVTINKYLMLGSPADREIADLLLQTNTVMRYLNDSDWFDLHPAVREIPGVRDEIERQLRPPVVASGPA
jgi:hypothetical protein